MSKLIVFFIISLLFGTAYSQVNTNLVIGMSNTTSFSNNLYSESALFVGPRLDTKFGNIGIYGMYQFSGTIKGFGLQSHFLGAGLEYRLLKTEKRFSPFIEINTFTEVATNYKDGLLNLDYWQPTTSMTADGYFIGSHGSGPYLQTIYGRFYTSTPFYGIINIGLDIRIMNGMHLSISGGYGIRGMSSRTAYSGGNIISKEVIYQNAPSIRWFNVYCAKLGISYNIPLKKREA